MSDKGDVEGHYHDIDERVQGAPPDAPQSVRSVRFKFGGFLLLGFVLALLMKTIVFEWLLHWIIRAPGCEGNECAGDQAIYRVSFSLFLFFLFHYVMSTPWNLFMTSEMRVGFNSSRLLFKVIGFVPVLILSFVIPNNFFVVYAWAALVLSGVFLVCQLVIILDFAYTWCDDWAAREETRYQVGLVLCTVVLSIAGLVGIALSYLFYGSASDCGVNQAVTTITLIAALVYFPLSVLLEHGSLLPSATVFAYTVYTCFTGLMLSPAGVCNKGGIHGLGQIVVGTGLSAVALVYSTVTAATSRGAFQVTRDEEESEEEQEAAGFGFFHLMMMLGSAYLAMLLTNWSVVGSSTPNIAVSQEGTNVVAMYVKWVSEVLCLALYFWTLAAPVVFRDREFSWS